MPNPLASDPRASSDAPAPIAGRRGPPPAGPRTEEFVFEARLPGLGIPVPKYSGEFTWRESFIREWEEVRTLYLGNRTRQANPVIWDFIRSACDGFIGTLSGQLCGMPCKVCGTEESVLDQWREVRPSVAEDRDAFFPMFREFAGRKMAAHGYGPKDEPEVLQPVPPEALAAFSVMNPFLRVDLGWRSVVWLAWRLYQRALHDKPVFVMVDSVAGVDTYRTGKTSLLLQLMAGYSYFLMQTAFCPYCLYAEFAPGSLPEKECPKCASDEWRRPPAQNAFDLRHHVVYQHDAPQFAAFLEDMTPWSLRGADEIEQVLFLRDSQKGAQKDWIKRWTEKPKQRQAWFVAGGNLFNLDIRVIKFGLTHRLKIVRPRPDAIGGPPPIAVLYEKPQAQAGMVAQTAEGSWFDEKRDLWAREAGRLSWADIPFPWRNLYQEIIDFLGDAGDYDASETSVIAQRLAAEPDWGIDRLRADQAREFVRSIVLPPPPVA